MLLFFSLVRSFYLLETDAQDFVSMQGGSIKTSKIEDATDIDPLRSDSTAPEMTVLQDPKSTKVFSQSGGGDNLIAYEKHGGKNQDYRIILNAKNLFLLANNSKCLKYDPRTQKFSRVDCNANPSQFDILIEVVPVPVPLPLVPDIFKNFHHRHMRPYHHHNPHYPSPFPAVPPYGTSRLQSGLEFI